MMVMDEVLAITIFFTDPKRKFVWKAQVSYKGGDVIMDRFRD